MEISSMCKLRSDSVLIIKPNSNETGEVDSDPNGPSHKPLRKWWTALFENAALLLYSFGCRGYL